MTAERDDALALIAAFRAAPHRLAAGEEAPFAEGASRDAVYAALHDANDPRDHPLLVELLQMEMRRREAGRGDYDNLMGCAFLLALQRNLADVPLLWAAKTMDFDASIGVDVQVLVLGGVDRTLEFLAAQAGPAAADAASYITACRATGDFADLAGYIAGKQQYFGFI